MLLTLDNNGRSDEEESETESEIVVTRDGREHEGDAVTSTSSKQGKRDTYPEIWLHLPAGIVFAIDCANSVQKLDGAGTSGRLYI